MKKRKYRSKLRQLLGRRLLVVLLILFQIVLLEVMIFRSYQLYWLAGLLTVLSVVTAFHLLTRSDKSAFKLSLVFLILLFPVFGPQPPMPRPIPRAPRIPCIMEPATSLKPRLFVLLALRMMLIWLSSVKRPTMAAP